MHMCIKKQYFDCETGLKWHASLANFLAEIKPKKKGNLTSNRAEADIHLQLSEGIFQGSHVYSKYSIKSEADACENCIKKTIYYNILIYDIML